MKSILTALGLAVALAFIGSDVRDHQRQRRELHPAPVLHPRGEAHEKEASPKQHKHHAATKKQTTAM